MKRFWLAAAAALFATPAFAGDLVGQASVIDGDTIEIHNTRIRLFGIDAPESDQLCRGDDSLHHRCGAKAANELDRFIAGRPVSCTPVSTDRYRRTVAACSIAGTDIASWLVRKGYAFDWPQYSKGKYAAEQKDAERAGSGVWAGSYVVPWAYRACRRIDHPDLIEPIREILPSILVTKVGRKGFTAFYRGDHPRDDVEWWEKKNYGYETSDPENPGKRKRVGLLDFLSVGAQTVIAPTAHPSGGAYRWTSERTLLDTPVSDLPVFTDAHRAEMERILREHGWEAPASPQPRREAVTRSVGSASGDALWHDDVNLEALKNFPVWVPALGLPKTRPSGGGFRAVATWRTSGSGRADGQRGAHLSFHHDGIKDFGTGEGYTPIRVVAKARGIPRPAAATWLRQRLNMPDEHLILLNAAKSGGIKPTYPDLTVSLADATEELCRTLDGFEAEMKAWRIYRNTNIKPPLIYRKPPVWGVGIETSGGKSFQAARKVAEWTKLGWRMAYVVPRVSLGEQVARSMADHGVRAQVYRGREQDDPATPGRQMCQNLPAVAAAVALGISVRPAVCVRRIEGKLTHCPFFNACGHEKQREATPDVWIITAASLLYERPDFFPELDGLVIDEKFHDAAVGEAVVIDTIDLWRAKIELCSDEEHDFLTDMRAKLGAVAADNGNGPLSRAVLDDHRVLIHAALRAATLEQRRVTPDILQPGMKESRLNLALHKHGARNRLARDVGGLWEKIALFLAFDHPLSGRIAVAGGKIALTHLRSFHPSWSAPVVALDATLTTPEILDAAVFGDEVVGVSSTVTLKADITIRWPDHVHVRQIVGAPASMSALGLGENAKRHPRNEKNILRYIRQRAALIAPAKLGVISYLGLEERLADQVPANVRWMHFGATSGLNDFESVAGLAVIGRWWLPPGKIETRSSIFAGYPVQPVGEYYRKRTGGIRMTNGSATPATVECHPDPFAEALRWSVTVGELLQAIGRLRGPRRAVPCFLDIVSDVLPVTVDEVVEWDDICPGAEADMMVEGVVLTNVSDAGKAYGVKEWGARGVGGFPNRNHIRETSDSSTLRRFHYQKAGSGQKVCDGWHLPATLPGGEVTLRAWLEARLGHLVMFEVEKIRAKDSPPAQAAFAKVGRDLRQPPSLPMIDTLRAIASWLEADAADASDG